ncbi:MAG: hypothetical protein CMI26_08710 [Opitutae bacterium]|nr:hypothetical protein [Opitutae bacterium]
MIHDQAHEVVAAAHQRAELVARDLLLSHRKQLPVHLQLVEVKLLESRRLVLEQGEVHGLQIARRVSTDQPQFVSLVEVGNASVCLLEHNGWLVNSTTIRHSVHFRGVHVCDLADCVFVRFYDAFRAVEPMQHESNGHCVFLRYRRIR